MSPAPFQWPSIGMTEVDRRRNGKCSMGVFGSRSGNSQTERTRQTAFSYLLPFSRPSTMCSAEGRALPVVLDNHAAITDRLQSSIVRDEHYRAFCRDLLQDLDDAVYAGRVYAVKQLVSE